ncbi:hypothetical protein [Winogradskyella endarachnes]|uniref:Uncharacterized protein n=1 Tax=Winogradskyella endarachnes TaxID=2681965 RepID=A0A6L6UDF2_9FLAO|nr:hypothetical protein [Winogradskyella endarachnes]MUU78952.1 hypothetical protein [Winogradskyella endarachnes]
MKFIAILLLLSSVLIISCNDDKTTISEIEVSEKTNEDKKITASTIEGIAYKDYALSPEAHQEIIPWTQYHELSTQIDFLKKGDFSFFNEENADLLKFIKDFKSNLPETLKTNPIISRNAIIETSLLKLNEYLTLDNIDRKDKLLGIKEVFVAFSNLNYQINKKLERDMYNDIQPE